MEVIQVLGVFLDLDQHVCTHIRKVEFVCFFHLRRLRQLRFSINKLAMQHLVSACVQSRMDNCNMMLAELPAVTIAPLQRVVNCNVMLAELLAVTIAPLQCFMYCNVMLAELPAVTIALLQHVMHAAAYLVARLGPRDHVIQTIRELHWLPVVYRIRYKLCVMIHAAVRG